MHHTPAKDRKKYISTHFKFPIEFIEEYLPTDNFIKNHSKTSSNHSANGKGFLNDAELSLYYKHKLAIELVNKSQQFSLIIEDDIEKVDFNLELMTNLFIKLMIENDTDLLFVGSYGNSNLPFTNPGILCNQNTLSRCTHAYIINPKCSLQLINHLNNIKAPIDWQFNYAIQDLSLRSCWSYPHIYQRTERQKISSLIRKT
jgi:hypothetical protein